MALPKSKSSCCVSYSAFNRPLNIRNNCPETPRRYTVLFENWNGPIFTSIKCYSAKPVLRKSKVQPVHQSFKPQFWFCAPRASFSSVVSLRERERSVFWSKKKNVHLRLERKPEMLWCWSIICIHDSELLTATGKHFLSLS